MATKAELETIWYTPDDLWNRIAPILGPEKQPGTVGRPATPSRLIFDAVIYALRTGCQWCAIPRKSYAPGSTVHGRFSQWVKAGVFEKAWKVMLEHYDLEVGIAWKWEALDGIITKAPLGGQATGPSPVDRGKSGTKRSVLTDGRGAPLALVATGANTPDKTVALETLDATAVPRPQKVVYRVHHLCLDKGYDYEDVIEGVLGREYILHGKKRGEADKPIDKKKRHPARRWVVERTHAWTNKFRRLLVRWERKTENYEAMIHLAFVLILYRLVAMA